MVSQGMGNLTTAKLYDIRKNENMTTFLTNVGPDFYTEVRLTLNSMMDMRNSLSGELRTGYATKVREAMLVSKDIIHRRTYKIADMVFEEQFNNSKAVLTQATPEEKRLYKTLTTTIREFKIKGGAVE